MKKLLFTFFSLFFLETMPLYTYKETFNYINMQLKLLELDYNCTKKEIWKISKEVRYYVFFVPTNRRMIDGQRKWSLNTVDTIIDREVLKYVDPEEYYSGSFRWLW